MTVRAKFKVESVAPNPGSEQDNPDLRNITLWAVYDSNPDSENAKFFRWTPAGEIRMSCVNPAANRQFVVGTEMYVDFTPVTPQDNA